MDDYVRELMDAGQAVWAARLSTGEVVWMDDGRPGAEGPAWLRLKARVESSGERVESLWLRFRSREERGILPEGADGYFFSRAAGCPMGGRPSLYYLLGHLEGGTVRVQRWAVPELVWLGTEGRDPSGPAEAGRLIRNVRPADQDPPV